ncbi:MAG: hypothetical protein JWL64_2088 [Frankiales bacterium]|nr:hypothetical protein [Frankiales bacterium]
MTLPRGREPGVIRVTTARRSHAEDIALRERRYLLMQSGRLACVVLGVFLPVPIWVKALFFVGAVALPWFGVVMANAGPAVASRKDRNNAIQAGLAETPLPDRIPVEPGRVVDG